MKAFLKSMFASVLGFIIAGVILMFIFFGILFGALSGGIEKIISKTEEKTEVKENSILHVKLKDEIHDRTSKNPFENFDFNEFGPKRELGLDEILKNIHEAKKDDRIKGIYLDVSVIPAGMATVEEIRNALIDFKESGKFIISYGEVYTQKAYYIASLADNIYLNPEGMIDFRGLRSELAFLKGALDKLDIEAQIIRGKNNKFKSAVEPLMYDHMSEANREQTQKYLDALWGTMLEGISKERGISQEELNLMADSLYIRNGASALKYNLIDGLYYKDELLAELKSAVEIEEDEKLNFIALKKYRGTAAGKDKKTRKEIKEMLEEKDKVAVVFAQGEIRSGEGEEMVIGSERISRAIRKARKDSTVKAIVLRVNSPGGSALASDVIWREVVLAKKEKPVVVSMGNVAASGGYYISCAADKIFANPNTITGSIGVFGVLPNMKGFFNNKLGVTFDRVKTNEHADWQSISKPLDDYEYTAIQNMVEETYDTFLSRVAEGRGMTKEEVDEIGQGRVWSGIDAKEIGLIDAFGGLEAAVDAAAELAGVEDYEELSLPKQKNPFEEFVLEFSADVKAGLLQDELGKKEYRYYQYVQQVKNMKGIQARLPFVMHIE